MSNSPSTTEAGDGLENRTHNMPSFAAGPRRREPTHPGKIIATALHDLHTNANVTAIAIGVTRAALGKLLACKVSLTAEMAVRIEKRVGIDAKLLLTMQSEHDLWKARARLAPQLKSIERMTKP